MTPEAVVTGPVARGWGPARQTLRALLARQPGLSDAATEFLVEKMDFVCWRPGQEVASSARPMGGVCLVVSGVVRMVCEPAAGAAVIAEMVGPGGVLHLAAAPPPLARVRAVAHTATLVGVLPHAVWREVSGQVRTDEILVLAACTCQKLSCRLYDKCVLLAQPIRDRVLHELRVLARDFGHPHPAGVCIDLPLSHADVAGLVGAARANVTRAIGALRAAGLLTAASGRLVLATRA